MGLIHLFGSQRDTKKSDEKWTANLLRLPLTRDKEWRIYGRESMYSVLWSLAGNGQAFFAIKDKWNKNGRWKSRIVTDATGSEAGLAFVRPEAGVRVAGGMRSGSSPKILPRQIVSLYTPIAHENISIMLLDMFGDADTSYVIAKVELSGNDSVYEGEIFEIIVNGNITGGYNDYCIGYDDVNKSQIYFIRINSPDKRRGNIEFMDYQSVSDPMRKIVDAEWEFPINLSRCNSLVKVIDVNNDVLSQIRIFDNAMLLIPSQNYPMEELAACEIEIIDASENAIIPIADSMSVEKNYLSYGCYILNSEHRDIKKVIIDEIEYVIQ